jgi:UDP-2,3-diacylglucosamine hydrolase
LTRAGKIFFASDFHLGAPDYKSSLEREKRIVSWLDSIRDEAAELYLLGDIFDFWFEYRHAVPKGYVRLLGRLADMSDSGIPLHIFTGNHDLWMRGYLEKELNAIVHKKPVIRQFGDKKFYLAHGDGLGPGDRGFKMMKKVFVHPFSQWLYSKLHPDSGIALANYFSRKSRAGTGGGDATFLGEQKEWLILHSREILKQEHIDYFIYGHRHLPLLMSLAPDSFYVNLGDWIRYFSYAVWDGKELKLEYHQL